jgi:hypothetical protein
VIEVRSALLSHTGQTARVFALIFSWLMRSETCSLLGMIGSVSDLQPGNEASFGYFPFPRNCVMSIQFSYHLFCPILSGNAQRRLTGLLHQQSVIVRIVSRVVSSRSDISGLYGWLYHVFIGSRYLVGHHRFNRVGNIHGRKTIPNRHEGVEERV